MSNCRVTLIVLIQTHTQTQQKNKDRVASPPS